MSLWVSQSISSVTTSPQPSSSTSSSALLMAGIHILGSRPFSKREEASVLMPRAFAVVLTLAPSKHAASNTTSVVSSMIPLYSPPITPATATGFLLSAITSILGESSLSTPSRVVIFSPSAAFLMLMEPPSM